MKKALIVYSGGLDTTVCIPLLREEGVQEIVTLTVDVGQPREEIDRAAERACALGTEHHVADARERFASAYCMEAVQANADYYGYPLSTALARPLIARKAAEFANTIGGVEAFVHGCTGKGNDQFRIEFGLRMFAPEIPIRAPIRERNLTRAWELEYADRIGLPLGRTSDREWSIDENLWGRSIEGGALEDPFVRAPEEAFEWTVAPWDAPDEPRVVEIDFENGVPVAIDGVRRQAHHLVHLANQVAGEHGVGRIDVMEDRIIGLKVRENYECPGASLLIAAHRALESLVATRAEREFKDIVDRKWADLVYAGLWWEPLMDDLRAFLAKMQSRVSGTVAVQLFKGGLRVVGRKSPWALYDKAAASFDDGAELDQSLLGGMVRVHGMESLLFSHRRKEHDPRSRHGRKGPR